MQAFEYLEAHQVIYIQGCTDRLVNWIQSNLFILGGVALGLAIPQLVEILLFMNLVSQIKDQIKLQLYNQQHQADSWYWRSILHLLNRATGEPHQPTAVVTAAGAQWRMDFRPESHSTVGGSKLHRQKAGCTGGSSLRRMCLLSPSQLSALLFRILSNLNNLGSCFCFNWAEMLEQQQLKNKKKNPPANAGDIGLIPGPGRSHIPQSN